MDCPDKPQKEVKAMTNERRLSRRMFLGGSIGVAGLASNMVAFSTGKSQSRPTIRASHAYPDKTSAIRCAGD
jgi:hypothetical protein